MLGRAIEKLDRDIFLVKIISTATCRGIRISDNGRELITIRGQNNDHFKHNPFDFRLCLNVCRDAQRKGRKPCLYRLFVYRFDSDLFNDWRILTMFKNTMIDIYLDWVNNFVSLEEFAEYYDLTNKQAKDVVNVSRSIYESTFGQED